jgi:ankyrin repeat protein
MSLIVPAVVLRKAALDGNLDVVKQLVCKHGRDVVNDPDESGNTALLLALRRNRFPVAQFLIESCQANVETKNNRGDNALRIAIRSNSSVATVQFLVEFGHANLDTQDERGETALLLAVRYCRFAIANWTLKAVGKERHLSWPPTRNNSMLFSGSSLPAASTSIAPALMARRP